MNRVLLVRLGALGDIVHAIPVAAALRRAFPAARLDWLVSARHREILDLVPIVDRLLAWESWSPASIGELRRSRYDVAIDLQGLVKSAALARISGAGRVIGFATSYLRERLARPFYTDAYDPGCHGIYDPSETRHVVEINLGLLEPLGVARRRPPEFPIAEVHSDVAGRVRESTGDRYALLNPGAKWPNKRWPPSRFGLVAAVLRERRGLPSVALWGEGERDLADQVVAHSSGAAIAAPPASIADLVALAREATVMVSGDTGPMHIAAAVATPVVGIFRPTRPSRNGPWSAEDVTVTRDQVCQCHHLRRCTVDRVCLLDIDVTEVVAAVESRLAVVD